VKRISVALCGLGTVGYGVYERLIQEKQKQNQIDITVVLTSRPELVDGVETTRNFERILQDDSIDVVIELIGGIEPAYSWIRQSLAKGKHVVTANKAVLARYWIELMSLAKANSVQLKYEASVGGGIPIIHGLMDWMSKGTIRRLGGILNGSTNYVLGLLEAGQPLEEGIKQAQTLGFMEKDPSEDIDGWDIANKLVILANLAFEGCFDVAKVDRRSLRDVSQSLLTFAVQKGWRIKYVAYAEVDQSDVSLLVEPVVVLVDHPLAQICQETNWIYVEGNIVQTWTGAGAGRGPTSASILYDLTDLAMELPPVYFDKIRPCNVAATKKTSRYLVQGIQPLELTNFDVLEDGFYITKPMTMDQFRAMSWHLESWIRWEETK